MRWLPLLLLSGCYPYIPFSRLDGDGGVELAERGDTGTEEESFMDTDTGGGGTEIDPGEDGLTLEGSEDVGPLSTIGLSYAPTALALDFDQDRMYVAGWDGSSSWLAVVDPTTDTVVDELEVSGVGEIEILELRGDLEGRLYYRSGDTVGSWSLDDLAAGPTTDSTSVAGSGMVAAFSNFGSENQLWFRNGAELVGYDETGAEIDRVATYSSVRDIEWGQYSIWYVDSENVGQVQLFSSTSAREAVLRGATGLLRTDGHRYTFANADAIWAVGDETLWRVNNTNLNENYRVEIELEVPLAGWSVIDGAAEAEQVWGLTLGAADQDGGMALIRASGATLVEGWSYSGDVAVTNVLAAPVVSNGVTDVLWGESDPGDSSRGTLYHLNASGL